MTEKIETQGHIDNESPRNLSAKFIINVFSGKEKAILEDVRQRLKDRNKESHLINAIIPIKEVESTKKGKKTTRQKVVYSGYIILELKLDENLKISKEVRDTIKSVNGVLKFIDSKISQEDFDKMMSAVNEINVETSFGKSNLIGQIVTVKDSVMKGFDGIIFDYNADSKMYKVKIKIFGEDVEVDLNENQFSLKKTLDFKKA